MARPPSPPPKPTDPADPTGPRHDTLSDYAAHLASLSSQLDARAHTLRVSEMRAATQSASAQSRHRALILLEARVRAEMTRFLRDIHARQRALAAWERRARDARATLAARVAAVERVVRDAAGARRDLDANRAAAARLEARVTDARAQLADARADADRADRLRRQLRDDAARVADDKATLQRAAARLEAMEGAVRARDAAAQARDAQLADREARAARWHAMERLVAPLQAFVDEYARDADHQPVSAADHPEAALQTALAAIKHLRVSAADLAAQRDDLKSSRAQLAARESRLAQGEAALHARDVAAQRSHSRLTHERDELSALRADADSSRRALDDARRDVDAREDALRAREEAVLQAEAKLARRDAAAVELEKTLSRRERSIRRAHAAVVTREKAVEARERELETERARLAALGRTVDLREDMLETRDLELSAREKDRDSKLEGLLQQSLDRAARSEHVEEAGPVRPGRRREGTGEEEGPPGVQKSPPKAYEPQPTTVRRQLEFDSSRKYVAAHQHETGSQSQPARETDVPDDESEAAAEQLLPELLSVRSYWRERVERLDRIVQSMREKTWAVKPHVQPVLSSVADGLRTIRQEIDVSPQETGRSPKAAYVLEQACQIRWRDQLKQHFDAVREVQAGLLIGLNREEDSVGQSSRAGPLEAESTTRSPVEAESSVEATLDATLDATIDGGGTRELTSHAARESIDTRKDVTSSFQRFRAQLRAEGEGTGLAELAERERNGARRQLDSRGPGIQRRDQDSPVRGERDATDDEKTHEVMLIRDVSGFRSDDMFRELASLRNELENVTGLQNLGT